ncbi:MAG: c-type cytochrome, partial [bacterium]
MDKLPAKIALFILMAISLFAMMLDAQSLLLPWVAWFFIFSIAGWAILNNLRSLNLVFMIVGGFIYVCVVITRISGAGGAAGAAIAGVNPEAGEAIFWGKGKCHTCHSIGGRGSGIRCPNLGDSEFGSVIGIRAEERALKRAAQGAAMSSATDYLVESLAEPGAHVVEGFKNEMPYVYLPPIALNPDEVKAVISYLQSQGGEV